MRPEQRESVENRQGGTKCPPGRALSAPAAARIEKYWNSYSTGRLGSLYRHGLSLCGSGVRRRNHLESAADACAPSVDYNTALMK